LLVLLDDDGDEEDDGSSEGRRSWVMNDVRRADTGEPVTTAADTVPMAATSGVRLSPACWRADSAPEPGPPPLKKSSGAVVGRVCRVDEMLDMKGPRRGDAVVAASSAADDDADRMARPGAAAGSGVASDGGASVLKVLRRRGGGRRLSYRRASRNDGEASALLEL
jgi:hypothetical protein